MIEERTWVVINLDKLRNNFRNIKRHLGDVKILGAVKAEAYGHGGIEVSKVLKEEGIDALGVASVEEAVNLKSLGIQIIILSPTFSFDIPIIVDEGFIPTVTYTSFADQLEEEAERHQKKVKIHIEIDTGMGRTGVPYPRAHQFISEIIKKRWIEIDGIFTHFAEAESDDKDFTFLQLERFNRVVNSLRENGISIPYYHTANSAAILNMKPSYFNMVRPGLLLYGLYPKEKKNIEVSPIMSLKTRVCYLKWIDKGDAVSYGRTYRAKRRTKVATISIGYGDGLPRLLSNKGEVIIKGSRAPVIGNVCMDLTMVDMTHIDGVKIGDEVTVIGKDGDEEITADEVARISKTISYEITSNIGPRVPRIYMEKGIPTLRKSLISGNCVNIQSV
ncbi:MAG: alanine racemase [bacterium (Candidatus Stahlbacteria) CG08_land_8_20_14_0_20_40_26]|nr:MAG: alanine racemase [bacterium (Candidatus Stahlbacteria) CG23_combo_of_CG06-09_8_20_14_all_40_9]PIS23860.1 MAG: alanine racemase [bacterium (Candidatus Stahlbacteria) CG08_land_8_20_14_0_20_40_26]